MERIEIISSILKEGGFALLDDTRKKSLQPNYLFYENVKWVLTYSISDVEEKLNEVDKLVKEGYYAVGCYSYELGYALNKRLTHLYRENKMMPLFHVGIYRKRISISNQELDTALNLSTQIDSGRISDCSLNMPKAQYLEKLARVKKHILDGDTYQVNYTLKYKVKYEGSPLFIYNSLRKVQKVSYGAFLDFPGFSILSRSPELFIEKEADHILTKPMKGTSARGKNTEEDQLNFEFLSKDEKSRAENVMIVDLLRNDLSRICLPSSVRTSKLFEVQIFETLHQMISTISGKIDPNISIYELFKQIFPCGSITGAPKIRTMEIIHDLEMESRGVYTGAIGYIEPNKNMCFNVAIRTLVLWPDGHGEMGIGSGVTHDSDAEAEYDECLLKAKFLTKNLNDFELIESLLYDQGYPYLDRHLTRLNNSAQALGFKIDVEEIRSYILKKAAELEKKSKVRIVLGRSGLFTITSSPVQDTNSEKKIIVVDDKVFSSNRLLQHKTSLRVLYNDVYAREHKRGYYDAIFTNECGDITEGTFNNIFIRKGDTWYTPPLSSGVLPGIQRQLLLESKEINAVEKPISIHDLAAADDIFLTNAVRGITKVNFSLAEKEAACFA